MRVGGEVASLGDSADLERDVVTVNGRRIRAEALEYWLLYKPAGVLTTVNDPQGRRTVLDLLPASNARLFPVGRLDRDTEGLLLLTNDGPLAHALLHPSHEVEREYRVTVRGRAARATLDPLAAGVLLTEGLTASARVTRVRHAMRSDTTIFHLTLIEGRKRQIRRACAALGHPVTRLLRVRMGPLHLAGLESGQARELTRRERRALELVTSSQAGRLGAVGGETPVADGGTRQD